MKNTYAYEVGDIVNENLRIIHQIRIKTKTALKNGEFRTNKGYVVQSTVYPEAPTYEVQEGNLKRGKGCGYVSGKRLYEGNSLYSVKNVHKYLKMTDDEMKHIHKGSSKKIEVECICKKRKMISVGYLTNYGIACSSCSKGISYPELFFIAYNESMQLGFKSEVSDLFKGYRFDFVNYKERIIVETHGLQHYEDTGFMDYKNTTLSDEAKRKYCKDNGWTLIELDCRESTFEHMQKSINENKTLPNIKNNKIEEMLKIIETNRRHNTKKIIEMYNDNNTTYQIAEVLGIDPSTVCRMLKKNNVRLRGTGKRRVKCTTTGAIYESLTDAESHMGVSRSHISRCCNGKAKTAGKDIKGNKLTWEYVK